MCGRFQCVTGVRREKLSRDYSCFCRLDTSFRIELCIAEKGLQKSIKWEMQIDWNTLCTLAWHWHQNADGSINFIDACAQRIVAASDDDENYKTQKFPSGCHSVVTQAYSASSFSLPHSPLHIKHHRSCAAGDDSDDENASLHDRDHCQCVSTRSFIAHSYAVHIKCHAAIKPGTILFYWAINFICIEI